MIKRRAEEEAVGGSPQSQPLAGDCIAGSSIARSVASIKNVIAIEMVFTVKPVNGGHSWHEKKYHQKMTRPNQLSLTSIQSARGGYAQRLGGATEGQGEACRWQPIRSFGRLRMQ
jgi:hypothetical protein